MTKPLTQSQMRDIWDEITDQFIVNVNGFGKIIRVKDKSKFEESRANFECILKTWVEGFQQLVKDIQTDRRFGVKRFG